MRYIDIKTDRGGEMQREKKESTDGIRATPVRGGKTAMQCGHIPTWVGLLVKQFRRVEN